MRPLPILAALLGLWAGAALAEVPPAAEGITVSPAPSLPPPSSTAPGDAAPKPAPQQEQPPQPEYNTAILQGLNKVTGDVSRLEVPVGSVVRFGTLDIVVRRCWKSPPDQRPENAALLDISEKKPGEPPQRIFLGWMFSSSPGLSSLEHPVYDIAVLACESRDETDAPPDKPPAAPKAKNPGKKP